MDHDLKSSEREMTVLRRFSKHLLPAALLRAFLSQNGWWPAEVRDYGEVPEYCRYFAEFETTVYLEIEPLFNDHHLDDRERRIGGVIFTQGRHVSNVSRYRLEQVDPELMRLVLRSLSTLVS